MANITDLEFKWTPGVATDVTQTWKRFGWVPPSEQQEFLTKWQKYRGTYETDRIIVGQGAEGFRASVEIFQQSTFPKQIR